MGVKGGPRIPKDGLVLSLDAANSKSFRGEPTTNLVSSPKSITTGWTSPVSSTRTDNQIINFDGTLTAGLVSSSAASWVAYIGFSNGVSGNQYTVSFYVKGGTTTSVNFNWGGAHQGNRTTFDFNFSTGQVTNLNLQSGEIYGVKNVGKNWWKVYYSTTLSNSGYCLPQISTQSGTFFIGALQIELKPYATPFVNGTRGSTVATGGGWADMTNNGNHGELLNGVTYDSGSLGSLSFDGVNDRVNFYFSNSTVRCYNSSVIFIVKIPTWSGGQKCILSYRGGAGGRLYIGKKSDGIFSYYDTLQSGGSFAAGTTHTSSGDFNNNSVVFGAVVMDADNGLFKTYVNGKKIGEVVRDGGWVSSYNTVLNLGFDAGGTNEYMIGNFYYFAHYEKVLSDEEIKNIYAATRGRYGL